MFWWGFIAGAGTVVLIWVGLFVYFNIRAVKAMAEHIGGSF